MSEITCEGSEAAVRDGIDAVRIDFPRGVQITEAIAADVAARFDDLATGAPRSVILTLTGVASISREARRIFGQTTGASAIAVLGESPVDRVIANFLLGSEPLPCPTKFFTSEASALDWLDHVCGN